MDGTTSHQEVLDELLSELNARDIDDDSFVYDYAKGAIKSLFLDHIGDMSTPFDASLDILSEEEAEMAEPCQAWFLVKWDVEEDDASAA